MECLLVQRSPVSSQKQNYGSGLTSGTQQERRETGNRNEKMKTREISHILLVARREDAEFSTTEEASCGYSHCCSR